MIHYISVQRLVESLELVFKKNLKADRAIEVTFKKYKNLGSHDRKWMAEWFYKIIRYYELYAYCAQTRNNLWEICGTAFLLNQQQLPAFSDFKNLHQRKNQILRLYELAKKDDFLINGFPEIWKILNDKEKLNERIPGWLKLLNEEGLPIIRTNSLKINGKQLELIFKDKEIKINKVLHYDDLYFLPDKRNYFQTEEFKKGYFEFQDTGSYLIGKFCNVRPGMKVVDACAGAGGKTLHLASLMQNKGKIIAADIHEVKLKELKKRSIRAGISNLEIHEALNDEIKTSSFIKKYHEWADLVLIDAPCTGSGVIKRNPDTKFRIDEEFLRKTTHIQKEILKNYSSMVKKGGTLIYATCSIFMSENEKQSEWFKENFKSFEKSEEKFIPPGTYNDGFYMCKFVKKTDP
jgi:16S rRNA (cytosine967-C5)-methyltransferase